MKDFVGDTTETLTAFLVDPKQPGVTIHPAEETIGCNGVPQTKVTFKNVQVRGSKFPIGHHLSYLLLKKRTNFR